MSSSKCSPDPGADLEVSRSGDNVTDRGPRRVGTCAASVEHQLSDGCSLDENCVERVANRCQRVRVREHGRVPSHGNSRRELFWLATSFTVYRALGELDIPMGDVRDPFSYTSPAQLANGRRSKQKSRP